MGFLRYGKSSGSAGTTSHKVQVNFNAVQYGGEFPFINHVKAGQEMTRIGGGVANPTFLNVNGYPATGSEGISTLCYIPSQLDRPGNWVIDWIGDLTTLYFGLTHTFVSGAASGVDGHYVLTPTGPEDENYLRQIGVPIGIIAWNSSNPITRLRLYHVEDSPVAMGLGGDGSVDTQTFNKKFKQRLAELQISHLRFLNWGIANLQMTPKWAYRKPVNYIVQGGPHYIPSIIATGVSNTGNAYTCTLPGGSLTDKTAIHVVWNATSAAGTVTLNGKTVCDYYGTPVPASGANSPVSGQSSTLVYDAALDIWLSNDGGMMDEMAPELMVQLCNEMSTGGWFHIPYLAADNPANYATPFATYVRDNLTAGLKAKYEVGNEIWGSYAAGFPYKNYNLRRGNQRWGDLGNIADSQHNFYGYMLSINGQAISAVYSNDRTKYDMVCGVQSATFNSVVESDPRLTSARYVAEGGGKTAASAWTTCIAVTSYIDSLMVLDVNQEIPLAIAWQTASEPARQSLYATFWASNSAENSAPLPATTSLYVSYQTWLAWGVAHGVNKLTPYEGSATNTYTPPSENDGGTIQTLTRGTSTVLTIHPAAFEGARNMVPLVGMWVYFRSMSGTVELEGKLGLVTASNTSTRTITVAIDSSTYSPYVFDSNSQVWCYHPLNITNISKAANAVITVDGTNGLAPNSYFYCFVTGVSGMTQINGLVQQGTRTSNTVWTSNINSSGFSTYTSGGKLLVPTVSLRRDFNRGCATTYAGIYDLEMLNFSKLLAAGGEFPSLFQFGGVGNSWSAIQPTIYGPDSAKWLAYKTFSNS